MLFNTNTPPPNTYLFLGYISRLFDQGLIFTHWFPLRPAIQPGRSERQAEKAEESPKMQEMWVGNRLFQASSTWRIGLSDFRLGRAHWSLLPKKSGEWKNPKTTEQWSCCLFFEANLSFVDISFWGVGGCFFLTNKHNYLTTSGLGTPKQRSVFHRTPTVDTTRKRVQSKRRRRWIPLTWNQEGKKMGESETYRFLDEFCRFLLGVNGYLVVNG